MNKKQAFKMFKEEYIPLAYEADKIAKRTAWNDFTDMLCKDGKITSKQYQTWTQPKELK